MPAGYVRRDGQLLCEGVSLARIALRAGTPTYVYSAATIRDRYERLTGALDGLPVHVHYSVKANSSLAILSFIRLLGAGVDIVSGGELHRALAAGFEGSEIVFSGVGKSSRELDLAVAAGIRSVHVESEGELQQLQQVAARRGAIARVSLRVNPDIVVDTPHRYTRTAERGMKFGIPHDEILVLAREVRAMRNLELVGLAAHLGSQIGDAEPYADAARVLVELQRQIEEQGLAPISSLDIGGGLGIFGEDEASAYLTGYAGALRVAASRAGTEVIIEPGRYLVADAGVLLTRVLYRKRAGDREIIVTDAGMNDFIRPSLYESLHAIESVGGEDSLVRANVVGPVCESGDFFATDRLVPDVSPGQLLVVRTAGAYGYSMASNYNSRPRPAEVFVDGDRFAIITQRESDADLTRREIVTPQWSDD